MFAEALAEVIARLERAKAEGRLEAYALIGGLAVSAWGVPRATHDIDFAVAPGTAEPAALSDLLGGTYDPGGADDPLLGVIRVMIQTAEPPIPVQLIILPSPWPTLLFEQVASLSVLGSTVPVVSWQALLLLKLYAGGPSDLLDARGIWRVCQSERDAHRHLKDLAHRAGLGAELDAFLRGVNNGFPPPA